MKKITPLFFLFFLSFTTLTAQDYFETISFQQALKKAKKKKKLLFVQLESQSCVQCNEVATKGLSSPGVQEVVEKTFISVRYKAGSADWKMLSEKYALDFGSLFFNATGQFLHKYNRTTSSGEMYIAELKKVQQKRNIPSDLSVFEKKYIAGEREYQFLRTYILAKTNQGLRVDTLLNDYLTVLPKDSIFTKENVLFLANTAPIIGSFADSLMRSDRALFNSSWMSLPNTERIRINQAIIFYSRLKAIKEKNVSYAFQVAAFTYGTYLPANAKDGQKARDKQMIYYYTGVKDSLALYLFCIYYADRYLMKTTKDSLQREDSLLKVKILKETEQPFSDSIKPGAVFVQKRLIGISPSSSNVSNELRELANYVYQTSNDILKLEKALTWINKALELSSNANLLESKGKILAQLNKREEAIKFFEAALLEYKSNGLSGDWLTPKINALKKGDILPKEESD